VRFIPKQYQELGKITFIGKGQSSKVYRIDGERVYALKIIECGQSVSKYKNGMYELEVMQQLKGHNRAVQLYSYEVVDISESKMIYILEEFHTSMTDYLNVNNVTVSDVFKIVIGICDALLDCKKAGVSHLDVKPSNVFIDDFEHIKIGDFSSSLLEKDLKLNHEVRGTMEYMAPEVYREGKCGELADIYSVGLIMYRLFNNMRLPFVPDDDKQLAIYKRLSGTVLPQITIPNDFLCSEINSLIKKTCAFNANERFQSFEDLRTNLNNVVQLVNDNTCGGIELLTNKTNEVWYDGDSMELTVILPLDEEHQQPVHSPYMMAPVQQSCCFPQMRNNEPIMEKEVTHSKKKSLKFKFPWIRRDSSCKDIPKCENKVELGQVNYSVIAPKDENKVELSRVDFSAIAPKRVKSDAHNIINIVMYEKVCRYIIDKMVNDDNLNEKRAGIYNVRKGAMIKVVLTSPDITIDDNEDTKEWLGDYLIFSFDFSVSDDIKYRKQNILFTATIYFDNVIATKLKFTVEGLSYFNGQIEIRREDVNSAFVSYASNDRIRVATIVQGMQKARPDMDIFFDVKDLKSGQIWEKVIYNEIDKRDILYLCWSTYAREAKYVEREWRYALEKKGEEFIEPIPMESPDICPPPEELRHKHFNDNILYIINSNNK
jgi:serine/threonine protein kinase